VLGCYGYGTFLPGKFTVDGLFTYYMVREHPDVECV
jgi:hypothetical protein